ncbi:hypothetical protein GCM10019059_30360 [Camelimonas fluminis]|uniref:Uncharacterized protein n=2 Tax=Camelimonas fluminis TaxID=1576911 RepID=A0ABV7UK55_9HYPH|nr:hypothetical protein GCM10019059_30360 [Camelimonas fluminis]
MRRRLTRFAGAGLALPIALALPIQQAPACTSSLPKSADGRFVYGRTLEFSLPLDSEMLVTPRNFPHAGIGPDGQAGGGVSGTEITEWTSAIDLRARRSYIRTYENSQTQILDLATAPLDGKIIKTFPLTRPASSAHGRLSQAPAAI